jgi:hypothetical protein
MCQICELLDDETSHVHTIPSGYLGGDAYVVQRPDGTYAASHEMPVHDQGAAYFHRMHARNRFWERVREEVKAAVHEALDERARGGGGRRYE